jgi:hypothetical protein
VKRDYEKDGDSAQAVDIVTMATVLEVSWARNHL